MRKLISYFTDGIESRTLQTIGAEIETQFVDHEGRAVQVQTSQQMLAHLVKNGWQIDCRKGKLITALVDQDGNKIFYELGRHNMEVSTIASTPNCVLDVVRKCLAQLYEAARVVDAVPYFAPILHGHEDLLVIPDERDANWLKLDGRNALAPLARTSSVQFTISVAPQEAVRILNKFGERIDLFLTDFPQDAVWKKYIADSSAKYLSNRYGGPLLFESLEAYCQALTCHDVVRGAKLVPFENVSDLDIPLYLRSIWWHFRLKRYGNALCIEVRPMARRSDEQFKLQLEKVLKIVRG
ncbi:MAG: hypothetical protein AAB575_04395 [Patescibacteria group bacterium]